MYSHRLRTIARRAKTAAARGTQSLRRKLIRQLEAMFDVAHEHADKADSAKDKEKFMRIAAYIAQVLNSLTKSFDEAQVNAELGELEKMVDEATAKGTDQSLTATAQGPSGS